MAIRLQDIADDLNLSKMTISKVLRGQTDVSAETKARVLQRVRELNYRPNISARSLRTGQTYMTGFVVPSLDDRRIADRLPQAQGASRRQAPRSHAEGIRATQPSRPPRG